MAEDAGDKLKSELGMCTPASSVPILDHTTSQQPPPAETLTFDATPLGIQSSTFEALEKDFQEVILVP